MFENNNGRTYFGEEFVKQFEAILREARENEKFLFIHGTFLKENAEMICSRGLECDYPELYYTAKLMSETDSLLYDKLRSWPHWDSKYLVMCLVPRESGKGGLPIWRKGKNGSLILPATFIKGYIDVIQKTIVDNNLYDQKNKFVCDIQDRSYSPITGKLIETSLPPDEQEFLDEYKPEETMFEKD